MYIEPLILNVTINGSASSPFTLQYNSSESASLTASSSASQFDTAVTAIINGASGSDIVVAKSVVDDQTIFQVVFFEATQRSATLEVGEHNSSFINVTIQTIQIGRFPTDLVLGLPTRITDPIPLPDSNNVFLRDQLYGLISVKCTKSSPGQIFWSHNYDDTTGDVWGNRYNLIDPQCGRYSNINPTRVFQAGNSRDDITGEVKGNAPVTVYNWVRIDHGIML